MEPKKWNGVDRRSDDRRYRSWWDGNQTRLWRILLIGYMTIVGFFCRWVFTTLTEIPKIYPTKEETNCLFLKVEKSIEKLSDKIDDNFRYYLNQIRELSKRNEP